MKSARVPVPLLRKAINQLDVLSAYELARRLEACIPRPGKTTAARLRKLSKSIAHSDETSEIRSAVMARAGGRCEGCGGRHCGELQLDHFFGRVREVANAESCWALGSKCHQEKTENRPSRLHWARELEVHLLRLLPSSERSLALIAIRGEIAKLQTREKLARQETP